MPIREDVFQNGDYFHIFDKTIDHRSIFDSATISNEFINVCMYYRSTKTQVRYSRYKKLLANDYEHIKKNIFLPEHFKVDIVAYCIMPNHYHLLLKQKRDNGISSFMSNILNSITRYCNIPNHRKGPVFLTQFRSKKIYTEEQLVYVARYIHTNPYAASLVRTIEQIFSYSFSSIRSYLGTNTYLIETNPVLGFFSHDQKKFRDFIVKNADSQKEYSYLKHIENWEV